MALPSSGIESVWRNHIDEVSSLLQRYHQGKFRIWNLSGRKYNYSKFNNEVVDFYFPDHHSPPLELLFRIIASIDEFLSQDSENVAVVHCIGGKGRTGTVIACYLAYGGYFDSTEQALAHFGQARSSTEKGVTQPSQRRYCSYFDKILRGQIQPFPRTLIFSKIVLQPVPSWCGKLVGCRPLVEVFDTEAYPKELLYSSMPTEETLPRIFTDADGKVELELNCPIRGDIMIQISHIKKPKPYKALLSRKKKIFRISLHCSFLQDTIILQGSELDDAGLLKKFPPPANFQATLHFQATGTILQSQKPSVTKDQLDVLLKRHKQMQGKNALDPFLRRTTSLKRQSGFHPTGDFLLEMEVLHENILLTTAFMEDLHLKKQDIPQVQDLQEWLTSFHDQMPKPLVPQPAEHTDRPRGLSYLFETLDSLPEPDTAPPE